MTHRHLSLVAVHLCSIVTHWASPTRINGRVWPLLSERSEALWGRASRPMHSATPSEQADVWSARHTSCQRVIERRTPTDTTISTTQCATPISGWPADASKGFSVSIGSIVRRDIGIGYACGDRLGVPLNGCAYHLVPVKNFDKTRIVKVSVHPCGQHCLALDADGVIYSWGTQTHSRLGNSWFYHSRVGPRIVALKPATDSTPRKSFRVVDICAGYASSAAITASVYATLIFKPSLKGYTESGRRVVSSGRL
uniref:Regulator of chromosome condensation (RCC1) family protein n=1 Tax=Mesocestoides corti TaxID=53468 RepID=A0A5K3F6X7_MESCO